MLDHTDGRAARTRVVDAALGEGGESVGQDGGVVGEVVPGRIVELRLVHVAPKSCDTDIHGSPPFGPFHEMNTSLPVADVVRAGLSVQETLP